MMCLSFIPAIKAMFANADTAQLLHYRDKCLRKALHLFNTAAQSMKYSDFCDSEVHIHHNQSMNLFQDPQDIAFALSTDGAQLTMKKQSDTWVLILMFHLIFAINQTVYSIHLQFQAQILLEI